MRRTVDGLVLRQIESGENDRRLLVLTAEGTMWMSAKGARSVRSKYAAISQQFSYANFEFYEKNNGKWLSGGSANASFFGLNSDLTGFSLACYIAQIAEEISGENYPAEDVLRMTLNTLYAIEKKLKPYAQIKAVYELFAANVSGFMPNIESCDDCGSESFAENEALWLDVMNGAIVCDTCLKKRGNGLPLPETDEFYTKNVLLPLDTSALHAIRYVCSAPPQRIFSFGLSDKRSAELFYRASEQYMLNHLERDFETLHFYNSIKD